MIPDEIEAQFSRLAASPDDEIDVALGALLIAAANYPELDIPSQMAHLDALAAGASVRLGDVREPLASVNALSEYLFDEVGFQGSREDYYDPRNSFLNEVLDRRLGIPITLSLVYIEVGKRLGVPLLGIGMPGHFLVRHRDVDELFVDTFNGGILISADECAERLREGQGGNVRLGPEDLAPVGNREFVARILRNLKAIYLDREDHDRALTIVDWLITLQPDAKHEVRDRGLVHLRLGDYQRALDDLEGYAEGHAVGPDAASVRELVRRLRRDLGG